MQIPKIFFNKRADISARKIIFYGFVFSFLMIITFLLIVFLVPKNASEISQITPDLENYLLIQRFLNSPFCFAYQDKNTDRVYPNIIDIKKFTQENLNKCYNAKDANVKAYRLTLNYGKEPKIISTKNWEGFLAKAQTEYVFVNDNGQIKRATLFIETQNVK